MLCKHLHVFVMSFKCNNFAVAIKVIAGTRFDLCSLLQNGTHFVSFVEIRNYSILSLAFVASSFRVTEENLVFEANNLLLIVFPALKGTHFYILFGYIGQACSNNTVYTTKSLV